MKIAVPYADGDIFQHFGHTQQFKIYEAQRGSIISEQVVQTDGCGHGALAAFLQSRNVDVLICGGIGGGARLALAQAGIRVFGGCSGDADSAAADFLAGDLDFNPNVRCDHHGEGHTCGTHGCGSHSCGEHCP